MKIKSNALSKLFDQFDIPHKIVGENTIETIIKGQFLSINKNGEVFTITFPLTTRNELTILGVDKFADIIMRLNKRGK